ncbi:MAG: indole-3-glycerol phosphate synthase TrpC [Bdellovibrionota bacterium]
MQTDKKNILDTILDVKRGEVAAAKERRSQSSLESEAKQMPAPRPFIERLRTHSHPSIIAEVKRASPSKGVIREDLNPVETAKAYASAGAACLSVLTDERFFQGNLDYLGEIKAAVPNIPLLRKDFTCDRYQVWETRVAQADALLLIVAALTPSELADLLSESLKADLGVLIEVHTSEELEVALQAVNDAASGVDPARYPLLGINNRDLKTFVTRLAVTREILEHGRSLASRFPIGVDKLTVVAESGIKTGADIQELTASGAKAFLIGESLLVSGDPGENLRQLIADSHDK